MEILDVPHGGRLVEQKALDDSIRADLVLEAEALPKITLDQTALADLEMIANGALSPLSGFMNRRDFQSVLKNMRLADGLPWTIPIVLGADRKTATQTSEGKRLALAKADGQVVGTIDLTEIFPHDADEHSRAVFGTDDRHHPGVRRVHSMGDFLLAGPITYLSNRSDERFKEYYYSPRQLRAEFNKRGWKTIVAFQTRNPIHRAHEYLMKCALESMDGLLLHPLVGHTNDEDLPADVRMQSYKVLLENYFNPATALLAVFPAAMRYAGPREAVFHAIVRKNYGCTHFIVGRDHAGAKKPDGSSYHGPLDAQKIFDLFSEEEIGIRLFFYDNAFYCNRCEAIVTDKSAPAAKESRFELSGTKVRELLRSGIYPPKEITRPEVAEVLIQALKDKEREREANLGISI